MPQKTLTRADLTAAVNRETGMSAYECRYFVDEVMGNIENALLNGEDVKISNFGTFSVLQKKERMGRNPKTNEAALVTARKAVSFRPSRGLKEKVAARLR